MYRHVTVGEQLQPYIILTILDFFHISFKINFKVCSACILHKFLLCIFCMKCKWEICRFLTTNLSKNAKKVLILFLFKMLCTFQFVKVAIFPQFLTFCQDGCKLQLCILDSVIYKKYQRYSRLQMISFFLGKKVIWDQLLALNIQIKVNNKSELIAVTTEKNLKCFKARSNFS